MLKRIYFVSMAAALAAPALCSATTIYNENFDVDNTANWKFNSSIASDAANDNLRNEANFFFDYSTAGIPAAPGSGGTTRGLKIEANIPGTGVFAGASASPLNLTLPNEYTLHAQVWQNFNGPSPAGGSGSTQMSNLTVGASGAAAEFPGGTLTGIQGAVTVDGNSSADWRVYSAAFPDGAGSTISPSAHPGVYAAGNVSDTTANDARQAANSYYTTRFAGVPAPAAQTALFAQQTGTAMNGTLAFAWHQWDIVKTAGQVTWYVDGNLIGTLPASLFPATLGSNFAFGHADTNTGSSADANARSLLFGLVDNIVIDDVAPEPTSLGLLGLGAIGLIRRRRA